MRLEVLTMVKISMLVFWVAMQCGPVGRYQHFEGTYCLHLQGLSGIYLQAHTALQPRRPTLTRQTYLLCKVL
jgi:hypothetical protein